MPDWFTHTLAGWITGKAIKMEVGLIVVGSLVPDIKYLNIAFLKLLSVDLHTYLDVFHTPVGAFLVGGIFALFFKDIKKVPKKALTMGIKTILSAKKIILLASGRNKANAIVCLVKRDVDKNCPVSFLKKHKNLILIVDKEAASLLS